MHCMSATTYLNASHLNGSGPGPLPGPGGANLTVAAMQEVCLVRCYNECSF